MPGVYTVNQHRKCCLASCSARTLKALRQLFANAYVQGLSIEIQQWHVDRSDSYYSLFLSPQSKSQTTASVALKKVHC